MEKSCDPRSRLQIDQPRPQIEMRLQQIAGYHGCIAHSVSNGPAAKLDRSVRPPFSLCIPRKFARDGVPTKPRAPFFLPRYDDPDRPTRDDYVTVAPPLRLQHSLEHRLRRGTYATLAVAAPAPRRAAPLATPIAGSRRPRTRLNLVIHFFKRISLRRRGCGRSPAHATQLLVRMQARGQRHGVICVPRIIPSGPLPLLYASSSVRRRTSRWNCGFASCAILG